MTPDDLTDSERHDATESGAFVPQAEAPHPIAPPAEAPHPIAPPAVTPPPARAARGGSCLLALFGAFFGALLGAGLVIAAVLVIWGVPGAADTPITADDGTPGITITPSDDLGFAEAVALKVTPSVVSIGVQQTGFNRFTREEVTQIVGNGSGVIIRDDGYILTNDHVIAEADALIVTIGVEELTATVVGRDPSSDLAVIKVEKSGLPAIEMGSSAGLAVGQPVVAIGSPFGLDQSVTTGIVSALGRTSYIESAEAQLTAYTSLIQTDAAINPGNSGGALTDAEGRLIGINTLIQSGGAAQSAGVGFAIPVDYARGIAEELIATGTVAHPYMGITSLTISETIATRFDLPVSAGVLVDRVSPGSPAEAAGVQQGDIIVGIGDARIASVEDVFIAIRSHRVGDVVEVEIVRDEDEVSLEVTLGSDADRR